MSYYLMKMCHNALKLHCCSCPILDQCHLSCDHCIPWKVAPYPSSMRRCRDSSTDGWSSSEHLFIGQESKETPVEHLVTNMRRKFIIDYEMYGQPTCYHSGETNSCEELWFYPSQ